jgi:SAM-dependent methyltransferase
MRLRGRRLHGGPGTAPEAATDTTGAWRQDPYDDALRSGRGPLFLRRGDGWLLPLEVERWCAAPDSADLSVLARCRGAVLDIGCGPGRLVAALAERGHPVLGIDVSREAVARTERLGGLALCRSVFEPLPGEGRWDTVLLIDGNIGIGGDAGALLSRLREVGGPAATVLAECLPVDVDDRCEVRLDDGRGGLGAPFAWARVGVRALYGHAEAAGWTALHQWSVADRVFVELARRPPHRPAGAPAHRPGAPAPSP